MDKSTEQLLSEKVSRIVQEQLGAMALQNARLLADLELARERAMRLEAELAALKPQTAERVN